MHADELTRLIDEHPLPAGFAEPQLFEDTVSIAGQQVLRAGIACVAADGTEITGSAAELENSPLPRAYFELLERAAIKDATGRICCVRDGRGDVIDSVLPDTLDAPANAVSRPARSNGVALHRTWEEACRRAGFELTERDRVLRSWYGELPVVGVQVPDALAAFSTHEWRACRIPDDMRGGADVEVAAVVGFPSRPELPLARGFAGAASLDEALEAAAREALQGLAFVWDEPVPSSPPSSVPSPMFHLDYYLYPAHHTHLARWLDGEHRRHRAAPRVREETRFVDLTPTCLRGALHVSRAVRDDARVLVFGDVACRPPGLPGSHVHPIP